MALFDGLLGEVEKRFNLGGKSESLLAALLNLMSAENNGLDGFLNLFRRVGLDEVADGWVSSGANTPLSDQQTEDALGENLIGNLARQAGLTTAAAIPALAYMIPAIVDALTPDGVVPNRQTLATMTGAQHGAPANTSAGATVAATTDKTGNALLRVLLPLLLLGLFAFLGFRFCAAPNQDIARVNVNRAANANSNQATTNSNALTVVTSNADATAIVVDSNEAAIRAANERARAALTASSQPQQVVDALNISIINFAKDAAEIPEADRALLAQAAAVLKSAPAVARIEIGGHTDNDGDDAYNQQLSERRAVAVRDELVRLGVNANVLTARGYGETKPRASNDTAEGRFQNRRIEYTLTTASGAVAATTANSNAAIATTTNGNSNHAANHNGAH